VVSTEDLLERVWDENADSHGGRCWTTMSSEKSSGQTRSDIETICPGSDAN
jgi:hypothetical protein